MMTKKISLIPDPRILPMLGEINLSQERCVAELVDNSIDAFLSLARKGLLTFIPQINIDISVPKLNPLSATVSVRDNAQGMSTETLEKAVKAGWSGNGPIDNLGLFGMGFNIATARLGKLTTVWTTHAGEKVWRGVSIDFDKLIKSRSFDVDLIERGKADPACSGTEVVIEKMKAEQAEWFAKQANQNKLKAFLSSAYSTMLSQNGKPVHFSLMLNAKTVTGKRHCVWGGASGIRIVPNAKYGPIDAFQVIDHIQPPRNYCTACWAWLQPNSDLCHICNSKDNVQHREQRIFGWLGILRYLSPTEYGIDFIRNGRKIEMRNRDLFQWDANGIVEDEYPIDDPRRRGRIVGEIHLNHCRVTYTKDRFYRDDHAWQEMVEVLRGRGPLQPNKAVDLGYSNNQSPLFLLYQAYRRSTPQNKIAGCYKNLLVVPNNDRAQEMASYYDADQPQYQDDSEWIKLIDEADQALLIAPKNVKKPQVTGTPQHESEKGNQGDLEGVGPNAANPTDSGIPPPPAYKQALIPSLTREYLDDKTGMRFNVEAYDVDEHHPALSANSSPWAIQRDSKSITRFYVNTNHAAFRSISFSPSAALIAELANQICLYNRDKTGSTLYALTITDLRTKYMSAHDLDPAGLEMEAKQELSEIAKWFEGRLSEQENQALFAALSSEEQVSIMTKMAKAIIPDSENRLKKGAFLQYANPTVLMRFYEAHPELFMDGEYWAPSYTGIVFNDPALQQLARARVVRRFTSLLEDVVWMAELSDSFEATVNLERLHRAKLALDLIRSERTGNG